VIKLSTVNSQRGKYVRKDIVEPVGVCDYSGFYFSKSDLVKQYEWRGNDLVWTGFLVGRPFVLDFGQNYPFGLIILFKKITFQNSII